MEIHDNYQVISCIVSNVIQIHLLKIQREISDSMVYITTAKRSKQYTKLVSMTMMTKMTMMTAMMIYVSCRSGSVYHNVHLDL